MPVSEKDTSRMGRAPGVLLALPSARADPAPFAPLTWNPRGRQRVRRLVEKVQAAEAELLDHLRSVNDDLEKRLRRTHGCGLAGKTPAKSTKTI